MNVDDRPGPASAPRAGLPPAAAGATPTGALHRATVLTLILVLMVSQLAAATLAPPAYLAVCLAEALLAVVLVLVHPGSRYRGLASAWAVVMTVAIANAVATDLYGGPVRIILPAVGAVLAAVMVVRAGFPLSSSDTPPGRARRVVTLALAVLAGLALTMAASQAGVRGPELVADPGERGTMLAILAVVAAFRSVAEEVLFRGVLLTALSNVFGWAVAVTISAGLSTILWAATIPEPAGLAIVALLGVTFGLLAVGGRSVVGVALGHALFSLLSVLP